MGLARPRSMRLARPGSVPSPRPPEPRKRV